MSIDLTTAQSGDVVIYVENIYEGNLDSDSLNSIAAIPWENWLQIWMQSLKSETKIEGDWELSLRLTGDRQMQTLNAQYRSLDKSTDVLAFATTEAEIILPPEIQEPFYLGDIVISLDTADKQAQEQNHSLIKELAWLSSHGLLHLLGWDHPDAASLEKMLERQSQLIRLLEI